MDNETQKHGRVAEFDPDRCQAVIKSGQCNFRSAEGSNFCYMHGGNKAAEAQMKKNLHRYRLAKWQNRLDDLTDSVSIKSLRDEIAILRLLVQERLNLCNDQSELLMHSTAISRLVMQIQSLSLSCAKVENALVDLMDQQAALDTAQEVVTIVYQYKPEVVPSLVEDIMTILDKLSTQETKPIVSQYKLPVWNDALSSYLTTDRLKTLRGEIGVLRILIEEQLNSCRKPIDLMQNCSPLCELIGKVEKMVLSCHRLEQSGGLLLTRETAMAFGQEVLGLISTYVEDGEILERIARDMGHGDRSDSDASAV